MRIKFRLTTNLSKERVTEVYFVDDNNKLELVTTIKGWPGIDFNADELTTSNNNTTKLIG